MRRTGLPARAVAVAAAAFLAFGVTACGEEAEVGDTEVEREIDGDVEVERD